MKKILLVLIVMLCLVGCKPSTSPDPTPDPTPDPVQDTGLTQEELFNALGQKDYFYGPEYYIAGFNKDGAAGIGILGSSYYESGKVSDFKYLGDNKYSFKINVPAFAGNDMMEPYDAYSFDMEIVYDPSMKSVVHVKAREISGNFVSTPFAYPMDTTLTEDTGALYIDSHYYAYLDGQQDGGPGYYKYFMKLYFNGNEIPCGQFGEDKSEKVIFSENMAAGLFAVRIYDTIYIKSKIAKMINGYYVTIIDAKTNTVVKEFHDYSIYEQFEYERGMFRFEAGQYIDSFSDPKDYGVYAITEDGLIKLTD